MRNSTWISISTFPQCQLFQCYLESQTITQGHKPQNMYVTPVSMHTYLADDKAEKHSDPNNSISTVMVYLLAVIQK